MSLLANHRSDVSLMSESSADLLRLINGYWVSQAISVAASLRLADLLKDGPRTSEDLAQATGTHARSLYRLLRALAAARVFAEHPDRRFALAPMGEYLRSDLANSRRAWAELIGRPYVRQCWSALEDTVRTGETAFRQLYGTGIWDWRSDKAEERAIFDAAMTGLARMAAHAVVDAYDFPTRHVLWMWVADKVRCSPNYCRGMRSSRASCSICPASSRAHDQYWKKLV